MSQKLGKTDRVYSPDALTDLYANLVSKYPIKSIEDPFDHKHNPGDRPVPEKLLLIDQIRKKFSQARKSLQTLNDLKTLFTKK